MGCLRAVWPSAGRPHVSWRCRRRAVCCGAPPLRHCHCCRGHSAAHAARAARRVAARAPRRRSNRLSDGLSDRRLVGHTSAGGVGDGPVCCDAPPLRHCCRGHTVRVCRAAAARSPPARAWTAYGRAVQAATWLAGAVQTARLTARLTASWTAGTLTRSRSSRHYRRRDALERGHAALKLSETGCQAVAVTLPATGCLRLSTGVWQTVWDAHDSRGALASSSPPTRLFEPARLAVVWLSVAHCSCPDRLSAAVCGGVQRGWRAIAGSRRDRARARGACRVLRVRRGWRSQTASLRCLPADARGCLARGSLDRLSSARGPETGCLEQFCVRREGSRLAACQTARRIVRLARELRA